MKALAPFDTAALVGSRLETVKLEQLFDVYLGKIIWLNKDYEFVHARFCQMRLISPRKRQCLMPASNEGLASKAQKILSVTEITWVMQES